MTKNFILYLFFTVVFLEVSKEKCLSHDSPYTIERINQAEISDKKWENFKAEVSWFLDYNNPMRDTPPLEDIEEDQYLREKWSRRQDEFARSLVKADQAFFEFRRYVGEAIMAKFGEGRYGDHASLGIEIDLTNWYIEFMQNTLFPHDWKELYENHKKTKNQTLKENHPSVVVN